MLSFPRELLDGGDLRGEVALVAVDFVLVDAARLGGVVEHLADLGQEGLGFVFFATGDGCTDALERRLHADGNLAVAGGALNGLASAFGGGFGVGHRKSVFWKR